MSNDPLHRAVVNNADRLELRSLSLSDPLNFTFYCSFYGLFPSQPRFYFTSSLRTVFGTPIKLQADFILLP